MEFVAKKLQAGTVELKLVEVKVRDLVYSAMWMSLSYKKGENLPGICSFLCLKK